MAKFECTVGEGGVIIEFIGGDLRIRGHSGNDLWVEGDDPEFNQETPAAPILIRCQGDCDIRMPDSAPLIVKAVGGEAKITNLQNTLKIEQVGSDLVVRHIEGDVMIEQVGVDFVAKHVEGNLTVQNVGADCEVQNVSGDLLVKHVGSDVEVRDVEGGCQFPNVGGDMAIIINFQADNTYLFKAGGDVECRVTPESNATFHLPRHAEVEIDDSVEATLETHTSGHTVVYGQNGAEVQVKASSFLLTDTEQHGVEVNIGFDVDDLVGNLEAQINEKLGNLGEIIDTKTQEAIAQATAFAKNVKFKGKRLDRLNERFAERMERQAERIQRQMERQAEREHRRAEREMERERRHEERMQRYNRRYVYEPTEPASPREPVSEQERIMILQMLEQGKITIDEAETLLRALDGGE